MLFLLLLEFEAISIRKRIFCSYFVLLKNCYELTQELASTLARRSASLITFEQRGRRCRQEQQDLLVSTLMEEKEEEAKRREHQQQQEISWCPS